MNFNQDLVVFGAVAGLATHQICKRNEPEPFFALYSVLAGAAALLGFHLYHLQLDWVQAVQETVKLCGVFLTTLFSSITVYRLSPYHPLAKYPGPLAAKVTQLWYTNKTLSRKTRYILKQLHEQYGPVVRIGPNSLSIADSAAVQSVHGAKSWHKSDAYKGGPAGSSVEENSSLAKLRNHASHADRRKFWNPGFVNNALLSYHSAVNKRTYQLIELLKRKAGSVIHIQDEAALFTLDIMNDLAYGSESMAPGDSCCETGSDSEQVVKTIIRATQDATRLDSCPWFRKLYFSCYGWPKELIPMATYATEKFMKRIKDGSKKPDIFAHFLGEEGGRKLNYEQLANDSYLIVIGGTDTTANAYSIAMMLLTQYQPEYKKLQSILDEHFSHTSPSINELGKIKYLDAVINESLRISSALQVGMPRVSLPEGQYAGPYWVPGNTKVIVPAYVLAQDEKCFSPEPAKFRPQRFLEPEKEIAFDREAYFPFGVGPYACIGKQLALQELRATIGYTVMTFDARFPDGFDADDYLENGIEQTWFVELAKPLKLILTERSGVHHHFPQE